MGCQHDASARRHPMLWQGAAAPCQLAGKPGTSIKRKAVVLLVLPLARSAGGGVSGTTALLAASVSTMPQARRGPRTWQGRRSAFATERKNQVVDQARVTMPLNATKARLACGGMVTLVATGLHSNDAPASRAPIQRHRPLLQDWEAFEKICWRW